MMLQIHNKSQAAQIPKQTNIWHLEKFLKIETTSNIMLMVNFYIQDHVINGEIGNIIYLEFAQDNAVKAYHNFSGEQAGFKVMRSSYLGIQNSSVPLTKCETEIPIKKISVSIRQAHSIPFKTTIDIYCL